MLLLAAAIALVATAPAPAAFKVKEDKRGIERAKKAGVFIDPAVEHMLATATAGSWQNDPLAKGCRPRADGHSEHLPRGHLRR